MGLNDKRILICDDDELLRDFYARVIKTHGYECINAVNGDEAIEILEDGHDITLAIIDLLMPVRTGWEVIEYMKSKDSFKKIPIIAVSGLSNSQTEFEKVKSLCADVLHKGDFELSKFDEMLKRVLKD